MTKRQELAAAADLHFAMFKINGSEHHYQMALQYQKWAIEAGR